MNAQHRKFSQAWRRMGKHRFCLIFQDSDNSKKTKNKNTRYIFKQYTNWSLTCLAITKVGFQFSSQGLIYQVTTSLICPGSRMPPRISNRMSRWNTGSAIERLNKLNSCLKKNVQDTEGASCVGAGHRFNKCPSEEEAPWLDEPHFLVGPHQVTFSCTGERLVVGFGLSLAGRLAGKEGAFWEHVNG